MKKISAIATSLLMAGLTVSSAVAAATNTWPNDFTAGAVVYGTGASADVAPATSISNYLKSKTSASNFEALETITEDEITLGGDIDSATGDLRTGGISPGSSKGKMPSLQDTKISWYNGTTTSDYTVKEYINVSGMQVLTTLDSEFDENTALTNDKKITYKLVVEEALIGVGSKDADDLYLTILGKDYEITSVGTTSFTVVTSEEYTLSKGESVTVDGKTYTITAMSDAAVQVNGQTVSTTTSGVRIDGMRVKIKSNSLFYNTNTDEGSVTLQIGEDISKTYTNGEEYLGEDEDAPQWVWFYQDLGAANGYIGVQYNHKDTRAKDNVVYAGESYVLPENFAEVKFDGLTDVSYEDFEVYFDDEVDLWNTTSTSSTAQKLDEAVLIIEAVNGDKDAIILADNTETNKIYLRWAGAADGIEDEYTNGTLEIYFSDVNEDISKTIQPRFSANVTSVAAGTIASTNIGKLVVKDTDVTIWAKVASNELNIILQDNGAAQNITIDVGGAALTNSSGTLNWLGGTTRSTSEGVAETDDVKIATTSVGTKDYSIMTTNGLIVNDIKVNAENDEVLISVPSDRVYGIVSVSLIAGEAEEGNMLYTASEKTAWQNKNVVLVGGSCVNSATATALGLAEGTCGDAWTQATTVGEGKYLIQKVDDAFAEGKVALVVAGYEAADTAAAASLLVNNPSDVDFSAGAKIVKSA
jgi:hypothetical protein